MSLPCVDGSVEKGEELRIAIVGCGDVGLVTGACLAVVGHHVTCVDNDGERICALAEGRACTHEPHLGEIVAAAQRTGQLEFTTDHTEIIRRVEAVFICAEVSLLENGESDLSAIDSVARVIGGARNGPSLVITKSTLPVGTCQKLQHALEIYGRATGAKCAVACNPEFLREGNAVCDFLHPDRIVVGVDETSVAEKMRQIYLPILGGKLQCPVHRGSCPAGAPPQFVVTSTISAELVKPASNSFLALKISYANQLAELCERLGADVEEVTRAMGLDPRIGSRFLHAGIGYGGYFFPKRIEAFYLLAERAGVHFNLLKEVERINRERVDRFMEKAKQALWVLKRKQVGVLGLSFKPHTEDTHSSPAIEILGRLLAEGSIVRAYDPQAMDAARAKFPTVTYCHDAYGVASGAEAILVLTEWPEFLLLDWGRVRELMARPLVCDGRNLLNPNKMMELGFEYHSIGRPR